MTAVPRRETRPFGVTRPRRAFGLDAARPPSLARVEAAILDWLTARLPDVFWLRTAEPEAGPAPPRAATLLLLLPDGRPALLRIDVGGADTSAVTARLAEQCRRRRLPLCLARNVEDARAALRRLGVEPEEA